jgi:hypothetical protein
MEKEDLQKTYHDQGQRTRAKILKVWWPHATLFYVYFFSFILYITGYHTTQLLYDGAGVFFMSGAVVVSDGSHHVVVMRLGKARFLHGICGLKVTVGSGFFLAFLPDWDSNLRPTHQRL